MLPGTPTRTRAVREIAGVLMVVQAIGLTVLAYGATLLGIVFSTGPRWPEDPPAIWSWLFWLSYAGVLLAFAGACALAATRLLGRRPLRIWTHLALAAALLLDVCWGVFLLIDG